MPAVPLVARRECEVVLHLRPLVEYIRYGRGLSGVSAPVDFHAMSGVRQLVAAFRLVRISNASTVLIVSRVA